MELNLNVIRIQAISKTQIKNEIVLQMMTHPFGSVSAKLESILNYYELATLYQIPGFLQCMGRFFRNKRFEDLTELERKMILNIPTENIKEYEDAQKAAYILEIMGLTFAAHFETYCDVFKYKNLPDCPDETQINLYKRIKRFIEKETSDKYSRKREAVVAAKEFLTFIDPRIALLVEVGDA